jgi:hypothetical protein
MKIFLLISLLIFGYGIHHSNTTKTSLLKQVADTSLYRINFKEVMKHKIDAKDAAKYINREMAVVGRVFGHVQTGNHIEVYVGDNYPNQFITIVLKGNTQKFAAGIDGKTITIAGNIVLFKAKPIIVVIDSGAIVVSDGQKKPANIDDEFIASRYILPANAGAKYPGIYVPFTGKVAGRRNMKGSIVFNFGDDHPNPQLILVLKGDTRFLADTIDGKTIIVSGKVINDSGRPKIEVTDRKQIELSGNPN